MLALLGIVELGLVDVGWKPVDPELFMGTLKRFLLPSATLAIVGGER
jgi:hypothetical protein